MRRIKRFLKPLRWYLLALGITCILPSCCSDKTGHSKNNDVELIFDEELLVKPPTEINRSFPQPDYCRDLRKQCFQWAAAGGCQDDPDYMLPHCPLACNACNQRVVYGVEQFGPQEEYYEHMYDAVGRSIGVPQLLLPVDLADRIKNKVHDAQQYVSDVVMKVDRYIPVRPLCKNRDLKCAFYAVRGDCETNETFMLNNCAPVCFRCDFLHVETLCPIDPLEKNAWYPGDLNAMFDRIISTPANAEQYDIQVLSRPENYADKLRDSENVVTGPWVVVIDNFLNSTETETLIQLGAGIGYERSMDVTGTSDDGSSTDTVSRGRTSTNAWCNTDDCLADAVVVAVQSRMQQLTGIPSQNSESLQLLQYEAGQFYRTHHDYIRYETKRRQGVRILTIFLYLNSVDEGGQTDFPSLGLSVAPKNGRALVWPSVLDENPHEIDPRTEHRANTVIDGVKYGANAWLHQRAVVPDCSW